MRKSTKNNLNQFASPCIIPWNHTNKRPFNTNTPVFTKKSVELSKKVKCSTKSLKNQLKT